MTIYYASCLGAHIEYYMLQYSTSSAMIFLNKDTEWLVGKLTNETTIKYNIYPDTKEITIKQIKNRKIKKYIKSNLWLLDLNNINDHSHTLDELV